MAPAPSRQEKYLTVSFRPLPGTGTGESRVAVPAAGGASGEGSLVAARDIAQEHPRVPAPRSPSTPHPEVSQVQLGTGWALGCSSHPLGRDPLWPSKGTCLSSASGHGHGQLQSRIREAGAGGAGEGGGLDCSSLEVEKMPELRVSGL